ncbi:hypothetical protein [uncultured Chryseobacterium sp.]|uniref:hypothetical protein n=1 Tax=uncultured Chryseobacterium sp. TaxID=259322 RepID=UPI0025FF6BAD|nr:hypothetical protein [uncultured Chryseobacterium sp.]
MDFRTRPLQNGDADLANEWLKGWRNHQSLPVTMYPTTGLVLIDENGKEVFIAFIWVSNSKMMQIGFITRNPDVKKLPKETRFNFLHDVRRYCHDLGGKHLITWTNNKFLIEDFKRLGFVETSNKVSELIIYNLT